MERSLQPLQKQPFSGKPISLPTTILNPSPSYEGGVARHQSLLNKHSFLRAISLSSKAMGETIGSNGSLIALRVSQSSHPYRLYIFRLGIAVFMRFIIRAWGSRKKSQTTF